MSQLLLSTDEWIQNQFQANNLLNLKQNPFQHVQKDFVKFDAKLLRHLLPHREFTQVATINVQMCKRYTIIFHNIAKRYKGLLSFIYHKQGCKLSIFFQLLNSNGRLFRLQTLQGLIQFSRCIQLAEQHSLFPLKMMVNYDSLQVFFQIIYFTHSQTNLIFDMERTNNYTNIVLQIYKNFIHKNLNVIEKALQTVVPVQEKIDYQIQKKLVQNLYRYAKMMTMKSNFLIGQIISETAKNNYIQQRVQSGWNLQMRRQIIEPQTIRNLQLYSLTKVKKEEKMQSNKTQFFISDSQENVIRKEIAFPLPQADEEANKKFMTFLNPIKIHQPQRLVMYPLNSGGYSQILSAEINFWLVESTSKESQQLNLKTLNRKILAVKKQCRQNGKNLHEVRILKEMKMGYMPLLPKYYLPINLQNYPFDKNPLLMMDIMIQGNLADFMKSRKKSTSLNNKLVLMFAITRGLRFLEKCKIVHLDFKPSNIMMCPGLLIKMIDFGEAYHSEVAKKQGSNYRPGITLPYSPPQSFSKRNQFTSKSDVYSLGVIFYQLIFGKRPFQNRQQFYLAPEECDKHGDTLVVRVLDWMISNCLSTNPADRPQLDWISMILRICIYLVI